jgi:hypothetical protein
MSRLRPIKPLLRQLGDNAYRSSPALTSGEPRELRYIALGAAHSLLQCMSPDVARLYRPAVRAIARGEEKPAKLFVPPEIDVRAIRAKLQLSQEDFASAFGFTLPRFGAGLHSICLQKKPHPGRDERSPRHSVPARAEIPRAPKPPGRTIGVQFDRSGNRSGRRKPAEP